MEKRVQLTLPEFAFVEGYGDNDELRKRTVIIHIRSMSIVEIVLRDSENVLKEGVPRIGFTYHNRYGFSEKYDVVLHVCTIFDAESDIGLIKEEILKPAVKWYCEYLDWEDKQQNYFK